MTNPRTVTDNDGALRLDLLRDRTADVLVAMILVRDVNVMPSPHVIADFNAEVTNYPASPSDETTVPNAHYWIRDAFLPRGHSCTKADPGTNHRPRADVDVMLVVDRVWGETEDAPLAEAAKFLAPPVVRTDRAVHLNSSPQPMDQTVHRSHDTLLR